MNPEIKAKWVAALRSGEYKQGFGVLRHRNRYCCLGVLCRIYANEQGKRWSSRLSLRDADTGETGHFPSGQIVEWAGLHAFDPRVRALREDGNPYPSSLAEQNDLGYSFNEIADIIEREL